MDVTAKDFGLKKREITHLEFMPTQPANSDVTRFIGENEQSGIEIGSSAFIAAMDALRFYVHGSDDGKLARCALSHFKTHFKIKPPNS
jgi:hypothetical protein